MDDLDGNPGDAVDALIDLWAQRQPDLDFRSVSVITRLLRMRRHIEEGLNKVFSAYGLSGPDFSALVTLARIADPGEGVPQHRLAAELELTPGTVSVRIDRLIEHGLAERRPDPQSRRNTLVALTPSGTALFDQIIPAHLANEERLLAALSPAERRLLTGLLRKLLVEFEGSRPAPGSERAGLTVAPAHLTIEMRGAVGLPAVAGMLVRAVVPGSPADRAGLNPGDVLLAARDRELRSSSSWYAAVRDAGDGPLQVTALRGHDRLTTALAVDARPGTAARASAGRPEHVL